VWFPSLAGLGALEGVHDLVLDGIGAVDLAELGSLRRVGGTLRIGDAPALRDLNGSRAVSIGGLSLSTVPELVSLEGLPAVDQLEHLIFREAPNLVDIAALAGVQEVFSGCRAWHPTGDPIIRSMFLGGSWRSDSIDGSSVSRSRRRPRSWKQSWCTRTIVVERSAADQLVP
jgi:hypothetical protein